MLDTPSSVAAAEHPVLALPPHASVEFRDAGFRYPGAEHAVLSDVTFTCRAGQTIAVIGSTGSGKTTLISLVARLFDVTQGSVLVNGVDVRDLATGALWQRIGLVPQRPYLFSGTVASNLRYGKPDATDDELWEALTVAQADDFVRDARRARVIDRPRRHQRVGWPAAAPRHRPRWCASRRCTCSTTRCRHSTWPPTPGCGPHSRPTHETPWC